MVITDMTGAAEWISIKLKACADVDIEKLATPTAAGKATAQASPERLPYVQGRAAGGRTTVLPPV